MHERQGEGEGGVGPLGFAALTIGCGGGGGSWFGHRR